MLKEDPSKPLWPVAFGLFGIAISTYASRDSTVFVVVGSAAFTLILLVTVVMAVRRRRP